MNYYRLHIDTDGTIETYNKITKLLNVLPTAVDLESEFGGLYGSWTFEFEQADEDEYFDFINRFLDILEPNFADLEKLGINKDNILFWLLYEYDQQCNMEFHPEKMKRLGLSGISLNISCWQKDSYMTI